MISRILKYLGWFLVTIITLILVLAGLFQTAWFRAMAADWILGSVNEGIAGELSVGSIRGNLISTVEIDGIILTLEGDTVASVQRLFVEYDIEELLRRRISLREVRIMAPRLILEEKSDSQFSVLAALRGAGEAEPDIGDGQFDWPVTIDSARVTGASALYMPKGEEAAYLDALNLLASARYDVGGLHFELHNLEASTRKPDLSVERAVLNGEVTPERATVEIVSIRTRQNEVNGTADWSFNEKRLSFQIRTGPVYPEEFGGLIGEVSLAGHPEIVASGIYLADSLSIDLEVHQGRQFLNATVQVSSLSSVPSYNLGGRFGLIDPNFWAGQETGVSPLSGTFDCSGRGGARDGLAAKCSIVLGEFTVDTIGVETFSLRGELVRDSVAATLSVQTSVGDLEADASVGNLFDAADFTLHGAVSRLNMSRLTGYPTLFTGTFNGGASGTGTDSLRISLSASSRDLELAGVAVDTFHVDLKYENGVARVDTVTLGAAGGSLAASGNIDTAGNAKVSFTLEVPALDSLARVAGVDTLSGSARIAGSIAGKPTDATVSLEADAQDLRLNGVKPGDLLLNLSFRLSRDSLIAVSLDQFQLDWNGEKWTATDSLWLRVGKQHLAASGGFEAGSQSIRFEGETGPSDSMRFHGELRGLELSPLGTLFVETPVTGAADVEVSLQGTMSNPRVDGLLHLAEAGYGEMAGGTVNASFSIIDSVLTWEADFVGRAGAPIVSNGSVPVRLTFSDTSGFLSHDRPFMANVSMKEFDLGAAGIFSGLDGQIGGILEGHLEISGEGDSVDTEGRIGLVRGSVSYPAEGINYKDVRVVLSGQPGQLFLDTLHVGAGGGMLIGSGTIVFSLENGLTITPNIVIRVSEFEALSGAAYQTNITGLLTISGSEAGEILFDGDLTVNRSRFYVPALLNLNRRSVGTPPMLVLAAAEVDSSFGRTVDANGSGGIPLPNFRGSLRIHIPRGTWLRGPRVNVELSGDLEIIKRDTLTKLLGHLEVEKGTYEFYGRKFVIQEGKIDFEEGEKVDPALYLEVEYSFRTDEVDNVLLMVIRGLSSDPQVEFFVNKEPVSEADAISYLVFGRKADDLNYGQKTTVNDMGGVLAADLAANMVNSQLSGVGSALGLDVVRVSGEDNWNKATLTAGKYITDDIYVAYERGIAQSGSSSVNFEATMLEYYLMRFLYMRLTEATDKTSGIDLILKFEY